MRCIACLFRPIIRFTDKIFRTSALHLVSRRVNVKIARLLSIQGPYPPPGAVVARWRCPLITTNLLRIQITAMKPLFKHSTLVNFIFSIWLCRFSVANDVRKYLEEQVTLFCSTG